MSRRPVRRTENQSESAYQRLRDGILSGERRPGERLVEAQLAAELDVSRTPVREALRRLIAEQLVSRDSSGGLSIHRATQREIEDIYLIREVLDGLAARLASRRMSDSELHGIEETIRRITEASDSGALSDVVSANISFHDILYDTTGNERLIRMGRELRDFVRLFSREPFADEQRARVVAAEHQRILEALLARDADAAERAAREHVAEARAHLTRSRIADQLAPAGG